MSDSTSLAVINKAELAIRKAEKIEELSDIRSHAKVFQVHVKEFRKGREALLAGAKVQLLAELKVGDIARKMAKSEQFGETLDAARLTSGQVARWSRNAKRVSDATDDEKALFDLKDDDYDVLTSRVNDYIQKIRENTDADLDESPSFRGFLAFIGKEDSEEHKKELRTEFTKQFCRNKPFQEAEKEIKAWLKDKGRSKENKEEIAILWEGIKKMGNLFLDQISEEEKE